MRKLAPDEAALWARVMATARPLRAIPPPMRLAGPVATPAAPVQVARKTSSATIPTRLEMDKRVQPAAPSTPRPGTTLDSSWDKRLSRGIVTPDVTVDLHGHTLHSAHDLLEGALDRAVARGDRVVLLVTGRPPRPESERPHARGAIRAAVGDWLAGSRFAGSIAAVRNAHPRHGGVGALYIILRREREPKS
ncbi:Smr/MutS family protein [Sphingomonas sp.]|uniref:Smr/MutS family protein n=1 Tax=Sphingomonas sp. TaxID=28214 RepID=UPI0035C7E7B1